MNDQIAIQFSTTVDSLSNWASVVIRHLCHSAYSHVDFRLRDGTLLGSSDSPKAPILSGNPRGVAIRPADYQQYGIKHTATIKTPRADDIIAMASSQIGKPFDNSGMYGFLSDKPGSRDWRLEDRWICSELCLWSLEMARFFPYNLIPAKNRITPADLLLLLNGFMSDDDIAQFSRIQDLRGL